MGAPAPSPQAGDINLWRDSKNFLRKQSSSDGGFAFKQSQPGQVLSRDSALWDLMMMSQLNRRKERIVSDRHVPNFTLHERIHQSSRRSVPVAESASLRRARDSGPVCSLPLDPSYSLPLHPETLDGTVVSGQILGLKSCTQKSTILLSKSSFRSPSLRTWHPRSSARKRQKCPRPYRRSTRCVAGNR